MTTYAPTRPAQTLYVTIRRDELAQLKHERDQLQAQVAHLQQQLQAKLAATLPVAQAGATLD